MDRPQLPPIEIILDVVDDDASAAEPADLAEPTPIPVPAAPVSGGAHGRWPRPVTWGEYRAVTRRVRLGPGTLEWFPSTPAGTVLELERRPRRELQIDGPCAATRRGSVLGWRRAGRIVVHGWHLFRYVRVEIELLPWSPTDAEVRLVPRARRFARWGPRRKRRYFAVAHDAGDSLRRVIADGPRPDAPAVVRARSTPVAASP